MSSRTRSGTREREARRAVQGVSQLGLRRVSRCGAWTHHLKLHRRCDLLSRFIWTTRRKRAGAEDTELGHA